MAKPHYRLVSCHSIGRGDVIWNEGRSIQITERKITQLPHLGFNLLSFRALGVDSSILLGNKVLKLIGWKLSTGRVVNPLTPLVTYGRQEIPEVNHG